MKVFSLITLVCATVAPVMAADENESLVRFSNNDQLSGTIEALTTEALVFRSPIFQNPSQVFHLKNVLDLTLPSQVPDLKPGHEVTLTLTSGDTVRGQLAGVGDDTVDIDTWFAGRMKFRRVMVRDLRIEDRPQSLFRGPTGTEGWTQTGDRNAWTYQNSSFRSTGAGGIAREVDLPDECSVAFDVSWRNSFKLHFIFFSDDVSTDKPENGYELVFNSKNVYLRKCGTYNSLGTTSNVSELKENEKVRIEMCASAKTGQVCLFLDDRIAAVWDVPNMANHARGKAIHFVSLDTPLRVSGIQVSSWDGIVDELPPQQNQGRVFDQQGDLIEREEETEMPKEEEGRMILRNGDSLKGDVISIDNGMIKLKTAFNEIQVPIVRLRNITLKPVELEEPKRMKGDVRAWFADGTSMVFRLDQVDGETFTGSSQTFGNARFKLAAFSKIEFNIYDYKLEELRMGQDW